MACVASSIGTGNISSPGKAIRASSFVAPNSPILPEAFMEKNNWYQAYPLWHQADALGAALLPEALLWLVLANLFPP